MLLLVCSKLMIVGCTYRYQRTNNDGTEVLNYPYTLVRLASRYIKFKVVKVKNDIEISFIHYAKFITLDKSRVCAKPVGKPAT